MRIELSQLINSIIPISDKTQTHEVGKKGRNITSSIPFQLKIMYLQFYDF